MGDLDCEVGRSSLEEREKLENGGEVEGGPGRVERCGEVRAGAMGRVANGHGLFFFLLRPVWLPTKDNMALDH